MPRRSVRLPRFDYRAPGAYFITICTRDALPLFGEVRDGVVRLSEVGRIVEEEWRLLPVRRARVEIDVHVVMPDHFHGIIWIVDDHRDMTVHRRGAINCAPTRSLGDVHAGSLSSIVRAFKAGVTRRVNAGCAQPVFGWQRGFYEHVIRNPRALDDIRRYIAENPARWEMNRETPHPLMLPSMMPSM